MRFSSIGIRSHSNFEKRKWVQLFGLWSQNQFKKMKKKCLNLDTIMLSNLFFVPFYHFFLKSGALGFTQLSLFQLSLTIRWIERFLLILPPKKNSKNPKQTTHHFCSQSLLNKTHLLRPITRSIFKLFLKKSPKSCEQYVCLIPKY